MEERVRRLGGEFEVQSEPGKGALVRVELPLAEV
jgi:signal transduction histidine kinase